MLIFKIVGNTILKEKHVDHSHAPDMINIEVRSAINKIKEFATTSDEKTSKVIQQGIRDLSEEAKSIIPSSSSLNRTVQNIRSNKIEAFKVMDLNTMVIPENYKKTFSDKKFLMYDSEDDSDYGGQRFLIFTTNRNLKVLKKCSIWQADGTFKCVPLIFKQLYTIHGIFKKKTVPLIYLLLPNKKKKLLINLL